jgi:hypothetical protein
MPNYFDLEEAEKLLIAGVEAYQQQDSDDSDSEQLVPVPRKPTPRDRSGAIATVPTDSQGDINRPPDS